MSFSLSKDKISELLNRKLVNILQTPPNRVEDNIDCGGHKPNKDLIKIVQKSRYQKFESCKACGRFLILKFNPDWDGKYNDFCNGKCKKIKENQEMLDLIIKELDCKKFVELAKEINTKCYLCRQAITKYEAGAILSEADLYHLLADIPRLLHLRNRNDLDALLDELYEKDKNEKVIAIFNRNSQDEVVVSIS